MKYVYSITLVDSTGKYLRFHGTAPDRASAEKAAAEKAGVPVGTEPRDCVRGEVIDFEV